MNSTSSDSTVRDQIEPGRAGVDRSQVARLMVADAGVRAYGEPGEAGPWRRGPSRYWPNVHRVGGDELGIEVFGQLDVFLPEHESGRRLGADDGVTVADGVGENPEVGDGRFACVVDVADDERGHSGAALARRHEHVDLGVAQHRDDRLGKLLIVVVGVDVDEIDDAGPAQMGPRLVEPGSPARRVNGGTRDPGQDAMPRNAEQPLEQPA